MLTDLQQYYLEQMEIPCWKMIHHPFHLSALSHVAQEVKNCQRCSLHEGRTHTAFARGNPGAKLMIIGEAPGYDEDIQGLPFVGEAGVLLNKMLASIGLGEQDVYIANVIKCRPPNNRDPLVVEIAACSGYLKQQINLVQPHCIFAVGRFAGQYLLNTDLTIENLRGKVHAYEGIPVVVSYHPAYLLRRPADKKNAFKDLLLLREKLS